MATVAHPTQAYAPYQFQPIEEPFALPIRHELPPIQEYEDEFVDAQIFGKTVSRQLDHDDHEAFATVSWILVAIVSSGCLLMAGAVLWIVW